MAGLDAERIAFGPAAHDWVGAVFATGAAALVVGCVMAATTRSYGLTVPLAFGVWALALALLIRRCGTVIDSDGIRQRGLRRQRSLAWSEIDAAWWGEYPRRRDNDDDTTDIRLYTRSRFTGDHLPIIDADPLGLVEPRTRLGRRKRQRMLDAVRALQAHDVPVDATTLQLRSAMWALGLHPDVET